MIIMSVYLDYWNHFSWKIHIEVLIANRVKVHYENILITLFLHSNQTLIECICHEFAYPLLSCISSYEISAPYPHQRPPLPIIPMNKEELYTKITPNIYTVPSYWSHSVPGGFAPPCSRSPASTSPCWRVASQPCRCSTDTSSGSGGRCCRRGTPDPASPAGAAGHQTYLFAVMCIFQGPILSISHPTYTHLLWLGLSFHVSKGIRNLWLFAFLKTWVIRLFLFNESEVVALQK